MNKHQNLFKLIHKETIVEAVSVAFDKLCNGQFNEVRLRSMGVSKQVLCGLFHELIVFEISQFANWRVGKPKVEADLVHISGLQLQVKTSSSPDGIAGNRYASENLYSDPSEYYLCVNFIPFESICKIRAGFLSSESWKPQSGKGNASTLKKEVLDELPFLTGPYLYNLPFLAINGIGTKLSILLGISGFTQLKDIKTSADWEEVKQIVKKDKTSLAIQTLLASIDSFFAKEV